MPIYEFECPSCHRRVESLFTNMKTPTNPVCDECEHTEMVKVIGISNFALKGSGWAKDGYQK
jgi:putative FmdB family regulatory protein